MARKVLKDTGYVFNPATRVITISNKYVPQERLVLITNVTRGQVIYNFSDPSLKATNYTASVTGATGSTSITLNYNTTVMSSTDELQFLVDEFDERFTPSEELLDPVGKLRVSQPQALIDTDFEYGTQISKWENLLLTNNRPYAFQTTPAVFTVNSIVMSTGSRTVTVTTSSAHGLSVGTPLTMQDTYLSIANGNFIVESVPTSTTITYTGRAVNTTSLTQLFDSNRTIVFAGALYSNAQIGGTPTMSYSGTAITVTTTIPHDLAIGNEIAVTGTTASTNAPNGSFNVATVVSPTQFVYYAFAAPTGTLNASSAAVFVRPQGQFLHRPFDGGVIFTSNANANFEHAIRQTRRYFRYQSGKGIQLSTGTIIKPNLQLDALTASGTTVTVQTKEQHNIQPGSTVTISGANETAYNGTFTVTSVTGFNSFQYIANSIPSATPASGLYSVAITTWYGASNRMGLFDNQNGIFWEFDGQQLYAVRRNSTFQASGRVSVTNGSTTITQTDASFPTAFSKQFSIGDYVVLRGQSYRVTAIASDVSMTVSPGYRGATATFVIMSRTADLRVPQSQFNIDKLDGTGPSGYNVDLSKMQMWYIDYSWYGAGYVRWGVRGTDGNVIYCHKQANNNVNTEAYMRSGNLPARYESFAQPASTAITASVGSSDTTMNVLDTSRFAPTGTLCVRDGSKFEFVNYTGKTATSFTGLTRGQAGNASLAVTVATNSNIGTVSSTTGLQVGQRIISSSFPENTFISAISGTTLTFSQAATAANPTVIAAPLGATSGQAFTYSATTPVGVESAWPTYGPTVSHWGTSVIMDGRYDDDKSLLFTYGQASATTVAGGATRALFSIRVAPSVDNGVPAAFGSRELINRMQLVLRTMDVYTNQPLLVRAVLNGVPSTATAWTNSVGGSTSLPNSSLAQIADYSGGSTSVSGGETTGGFFVSGVSSIELNTVRDLGNAILGGGGANANTNIYPDGPDVLTITVTNLSGSSASVFGRISWTEAQA
jgi:hypothetical protein